ncbi:FAD/NAD(P)-binding domain-containing protein [Gymnopus androsaceus JB14]|uniref:FAD/NAD(P)-binding domain-containing protein n=1 Tax=Gymnopus androsaceus JB14 TaxID=1447944 RepID=A0A6A4II16_9AGAR|nr:FAD/NAD(P)-binding domain-containing protein [Gymnopus androsaceus JB14]
MQKSANRVNVLIAGAGPVGLVSALLLLRNGLSVRIIAKEGEFRTGYRGPSIQPRTLELYKFLGILDDIWAASGGHQLIHRYTLPDDGQPPLIMWGEEPPVIQTVDKPYFDHRNIGQVDHEAVLRNCLLKDYGVQVELGLELVKYEHSLGSDFVSATIKNAIQDGTTEVAEFDWLIGAEGAHSVTRKQLGCTFLGESYSQAVMLLGDIHLLNGWGDDHIKVWGELGKKAVLFRPYQSAYSAQHSTPTQTFNDTRTQVMLSASDLELERLATLCNDRDALVEEIYALSGRRDLLFGNLIDAAIWKPNVRMVDKFGEGRVYIAGDAAHVHSPTGGQGLNSGIHDAFNLAWKLSLVHKGLAPFSLLESYTTERARIIGAMLNKTTALLNETFLRSSSGGGSNLGWARGFEIRMFGINYRGSPIVMDDVQPPAEVLDPYKMSPDEPVRGGDRAPEAVGLKVYGGDHPSSEETTTSLFEIFKPTYHTALVFTASPRTPGLQEVLVFLQAHGKGKSETVRAVIIHPQSPSGFESVQEALGKELAGIDEVMDTEGHACRVYLRSVPEFVSAFQEGGEGLVVVVVRPDGHVGTIAKDVEGVEMYFRMVFV